MHAQASRGLNSHACVKRSKPANFPKQLSGNLARDWRAPAGLGVQLQSASVARILTRIVPPRRCGGARKADPTRQPPGACIQASATAGSAPARHDSGPRGVADGAESAPEARPAVGWSPRSLSGCRHGHLRSSCARCASRWPGAAARALCRCLLSLDGRRAPCSRPILSLPPASAPERPPPHTDYCRYDCRPSLSRPFVLSARTTDVLPPLRPRSGPLVDTRNQQTPVSELLCRLGASIADGGTPGPALSHTVERGTARAHAAHLCCAGSVPAAHSSSTTATGAPSHITPLAHVHPRIHSLTLS